MQHNKGKVVSGVYVNDAGVKKVMTRTQFIRRMRVKSNADRWRQYRVPKKTK